MYHVHGLRGLDPTEPHESNPYPLKPLPHEPRIQELFADIEKLGLQPFPLPIGVKDPEKGEAPLVLDRFDGFPDPTESKGDAQIMGIKEALKHPNVSLMTNARVEKLNTDASGKKISEVVVSFNGEQHIFKADLVIVACGAVNSAALLFNSANEQHPNGLGKASDVVGRHYMAHNNSALLAISKKPNLTKFGKTFAINDYYFGSDDFEFPLGHIQMLGKSDPVMYKEDAPAIAPGFTLELMANHALDFWMTSEDLPNPENRVTTCGFSTLPLWFRIWTKRTTYSEKIE